MYNFHITELSGNDIRRSFSKRYEIFASNNVDEGLNIYYPMQ